MSFLKTLDLGNGFQADWDTGNPILARVTCKNDNPVIVSWQHGDLTCDCPVARKCQPGRKLCNHIMMILRAKIDRLILAEGEVVDVNVPFTLMPKGSPYLKKNVSFWLMFRIARQVGMDIFDVDLFPPGSTGGIINIGFADESMSRNNLRSMAWPYMLEYSLGVSCPRCHMMVGSDCEPSEMQQTEIMNVIVVPAHFIMTNRYKVCVDCWDKAEAEEAPF